MGKPGRSCLSIIACGRDPGDRDDLDLLESGASSDKHRWSFRKRSSRHRVLSNTVISEPLPVVGINKECPEASCTTSNPPADSFICEKIPSPKKTNDILQQSLGTVDAKVVDASVTTEDVIKPDPGIRETAAAVIQATVRGYLARKEMQKLKSVVKLQAAVRGHLVRRQAAGTLRCVQAIVKMQALVRARLVRQPAESLTNQGKLGTTCWTDDEKSNFLGKEVSGTKQKKSHCSTEKLVTNGFARQLLESTPKTKPIHIHCDPLRSESAWKWLERWMALSASDVGQEQDINLKPAYEGQRRSTKPGSFEVADEVSSAETVSADAQSSPILQAQEEDMIINSASDFEFQTPTPIPVECLSPLAKDDQEHYQHKNDDVKNENIKETSGSSADKVLVKSASILQSPDVLFDKPEEQLDHFTNRTMPDLLETEDKKFAFGTRKVCNPAFAAAQAKFEELSSVGSLRSRSSNQDVSVGSRSENLTFDSFTKDNDNITEESVSQEPKVQTATSDCGTEISISSTLDSPDRSEAEGEEIVLELGALERRDHDENDSSNNAFEDVNSDTKNTSDTEVLQPSKLEVMNENPTNLIVALDSVQTEQKPCLEHVAEQASSDINVHQANVVDQEANRSTPEGSPRSHITASESHGTPSSQISVNTKKTKVENNIHRRKQRSQVAGGKRSPSSLDTSSGGRNSAEHLPKDTKNVKRRNSFGMAVSDHVEHEPRASTSNLLPSYMQATESARAKVANSSPKSSPDAHKDSHARKRHSLPMGNGKQGSSPRMQRSSSQMQPNAKQNGTHSPHNSAERRWQR